MHKDVSQNTLSWGDMMMSRMNRLAVTLAVLGGIGLMLAISLLAWGLGALSLDIANRAPRLVVLLGAERFAPSVLLALAALLFSSGGRVGYAGAVIGAVGAAGYWVLQPWARDNASITGGIQALLVLYLFLGAATAVVSVLALYTRRGVDTGDESLRPGESG